MYKPVILIFILIIFETITISSESLISYIEGTVTIRRGTEEFDGDFGFQLMKDDVIQTGENSLAILDLEERGTLKLRENTNLILSDLGKQMKVSLKSGGLFSRIKKILGLEYEVVTQDVVAGVRGTEFFMAYGQKIEDTQDLWLCVNEGTVEVAVYETKDSVFVHEGEGITIPAGNRLTDPRYYKWTENLNWNLDPEMGNIKDETDLNAAYSDLRDFDYD